MISLEVKRCWNSALSILPHGRDNSKSGNHCARFGWGHPGKKTERELWGMSTFKEKGEEKRRKGLKNKNPEREENAIKEANTEETSQETRRKPQCQRSQRHQIRQRMEQGPLRNSSMKWCFLPQLPVLYLKTWKETDTYLAPDLTPPTSKTDFQVRSLPRGEVDLSG